MLKNEVTLLPKALDLFVDSNRLRVMMKEWEDSESKMQHDKRLGEWIGAGKSVVDLGCGAGRLIPHLRGGEYVGYDISAAMLDIARDLYPGYTFHERDIFVGDNSRSYDVAVAYAVAQHCDRPLDVMRLLMREWKADRYIFSFLVGDIWEDLYLSTVVNFGKLLVFLDEVRLLRMHVEKHGPERFGWVIVEVSGESCISAGIR